MSNNTGVKLKKLRKSKKLTLRDLADKLGVTHSYLSKIERGVTNPSLKMINSLAEFFDVDQSYFFTDEKNLDNFTDEELELTFERDLSIEYLREKYNITLGGKEVSDDEIKVMLEVLKAYRESKGGSSSD
ncbi:helix-turn-helix transcriptional regulator [Bacillus amyloliquefaciens]|uniref:helix-turn-helix domain-containing protein n=1 Tax=Bacillus amyloliquefaciens group TaxID=1938374 RepID=UPI000B4360D3|nr:MULTISPECIES: helix-turn-helix transcriptional regulator [Bacillus amyloliquefaciens group]ARW39859.1 putative HTH-type transcriptional regulator YqaE [Bacillus amyloliquefaciens]MCM8508090.1 helix-turn-helix domain-containing protein [Bacillus amyloliquefaciens]MEC0387741.1 helix-turn-helix transcriptional regulator [Bacillus velezensis]QAW50768.1 XRE family transcriptional regulator [Bacillus velezensis]WJM60578.1 helix-turn-helix transcriptional regulator [Bacillus amyloliquefaciens]